METKDEKKAEVAKPSFWKQLCDTLHNAMCYFNASHSIEEGRDPRVDLNELRD